ncbi:MAG: hypothetical protein V1738_01915 [Patescibacteria group bacterium]
MTACIVLVVSSALGFGGCYFMLATNPVSEIGVLFFLIGILFFVNVAIYALTEYVHFA